MNGRHEVQLAASAERDIERLPNDLARPVRKFLDGQLRSRPRKAGDPLEGARAGMYEALGDGWRVLYQVDDERQVVHVVVVARRLGVAPSAATRRR